LKKNYSPPKKKEEKQMARTLKKTQEEADRLSRIADNYIAIMEAIEQQKAVQMKQERLRAEKAKKTLQRIRAGKSIRANTPYEHDLDLYERNAIHRFNKYSGKTVKPYADLSYSPSLTFEYLISLLPFIYSPHTSEKGVRIWLEQIYSLQPPPSKEGTLLNIHLPVTAGSLHDYGVLVNQELNEQVPEPTIDFLQGNVPHITIAMMSFITNKVDILKNLIREYVLETPIVISGWARPVTPPGGPVSPYGMIWTIEDGGSIQRILDRLFPVIREFVHPSAFTFIPPWLKFSKIDQIKEKLRSIHTCGSANITLFEPHLTVCHTKTPQAWNTLPVTNPPLHPVPQIIEHIDIQKARVQNGSVIHNSLK